MTAFDSAFTSEKSMEEAGKMLHVPLQSSSYRYLFGDHDHYLDASLSDSHSSAPSPYDMSLLGEMARETASPSPASRETDDGCESSLEVLTSGKSGGSQLTAKRKRENRYKNAPPSVLSRRRAQNRASQRAYRERKDQRIKDLEQMLNDARAQNEILSHAYTRLQAEYIKLKSSPSSASNLVAQNTLTQSHQHLLTTAYNPVSGPAISMSSGDMFVDTASMAVLNAENDPGSYLYSNVEGYAL